MKYILTLSSTLFWVLALNSQSQLVTLNFSTPSLFDADQKTMTVYLPPDYDASTDDQYRLVIFLHGSGNSNASTVAGPIRRAMDNMIQRRIDFPASIDPSDFRIRPMIIVMPQLKAEFTDKPSFSSAHQYENSEYFGNYEDVIIKDLMDALQIEEEYNLKNKINFSRETMGIAGFSSGADGALRIGLKHRDKFVAIGAHAAYASLRPTAVWEPILDQYRAGTPIFVDEVSGLSAVWIGLTPDGEPDLLVNENGVIIPEKLQIMQKNADVIKNYFNQDESERSTEGFLNLAESDDSNMPFIYADCGRDDIWLRGFNQDFIAFMETVYPDNFGGGIIFGLNHQVTESSVSRSLDFIDSKMEATTSIILVDDSPNIQIYPNPIHDQIHLDLGNIPFATDWIHIVNNEGQILHSIQRTNKNDRSVVKIDTSNFPNGLYNVVLRSKDYLISEKVVILH